MQAEIQRRAQQELEARKLARRQAEHVLHESAPPPHLTPERHETLLPELEASTRAFVAPFMGSLITPPSLPTFPIPRQMPPAVDMPYDYPYPRGRGDGTVYDRLHVPGPREQLTFDMLRSTGPLLALMPQEIEDSLITPGTAGFPTRQDPLTFPN